MLFNSSQYVIFFPVVLLLHFLLPHRARWLLLLVASCLFYMAFVPSYILILAGTIVIDYFAGIWIEESQGFRRRAFLWLSLAANVGILAVFKYLGFLTANLSTLSRFAGFEHDFPTLNILLPVGLSFHTFQAMSYTIEVYRGNQAAERHFGIYALYVMFFPQLVAGPIERPQNLLRQFRKKRYLEFNRVTLGLRWILLGMFKKVVIADQLAIVVNTVYADPTAYAGPYLTLATFFFAIQIYCDFSGYSDIALGSAKLLGFDLMTNFRRPYFAASIGDFWRRWHISLSTWFKDYVYIPLGGNRVTVARRCVNLMLVFLLSGLWHGAAWTFVIWGALHGLYMIAETMSGRRGGAVDGGTRSQDVSGFGRLCRSALVFILVCVTWIFFRARSPADAMYIVTHLASFERFTSSTLWHLGLPRFEMMIAFASILLLFLVDWLQEYPLKPVTVLWSLRPVRWTAYVAGLFAIVCFGTFGRVEFIYFQF